MKTSITITGQSNSKRMLINAIQTIDCELKNHNVGVSLYFKTKKEATKTLSNAYQSFRLDMEDFNASCVSYRRGSSLSYDAGRAYLNEH